MEFNEHRDFYNFLNEIKNKGIYYQKIMHLSIFIDSNDEEFKRLYLNAAENHNKKILEDPNFYDAGFDLFLPKNNDITSYRDGTKFFSTVSKDIPIHVNKVDFKVKCCAKMYNSKNTYFTPFYTYARSSLSKTPLRLANNQGIIDAGYRGNLIGMFDCIYHNDKSYDSDFDWYMEKYSRILQICAPGLVPIYVKIVEQIEELGPSTSRGEGGFGSTGN